MTDGLTHALIVYGEWLYIKRPRSKQALAIGHDDWMDRATLRRLDEYCDEIWGLLSERPIEVHQFSYDGGWLGTTNIAIPTKSEYEITDWSVDDQLIIARQSDNCWAELVDEVPHTADEIVLEARSIVLPAPFGSRQIYTPTVGGVPLHLRNPIIVPNGLFEEKITWISIDRGVTKHGGVAELSDDEIAGSVDIYAEQTTCFVAQLGQLFELLAGDGIFGCDAYGQGWPPGEGWDIAADLVPKKVRTELGWECESDMLLCWCDTRHQIKGDQEEQAYELYSSRGMHEEWQDRVDIHSVPLSRAVTSTYIFYYGPNADCKKRIAEAIVKHAPAAGLAATWCGNVEIAVTVCGI